MNPLPTIHIVPHTHWDREWYAPFQVFRARLVELWDDLLSLTETDPDFTFLMDGQTVVIEDYLAIRPEARARVNRAIAERRIIVGPWYTLPDEFLVSGETLVRNLERGIALGEAHGGAMRVGYLPDSFGHAAQMPQIYRQFGLTHAVVWRGVPSSIDRLAFIWEAPDGSAVLTAYMATSYGHGHDLPLTGPALAERLRAAVKALEPFRPGPDVLLMNGNDHASPQARLTTAVAEANQHLNGATARLARLDDYLRRLPPDGWPHWKGELRASSRANVLMGVLSVRIPDKQAYFRATESLERRAEPLVALTGIKAGGFLHEAWTLILQNAPHDTACGCGIDAVAEEARLRSQAAQQIADAVARRALAHLAEESGASDHGRGPGLDVVVWNPSPFPRAALVTLELPGDEPSWTAENAEGALAVQVLGPATGGPPESRRALVPTGIVEGCSWSRIRVRPGAPGGAARGVRADGDALENEWIRCRIDPHGTLSVADAQTGTAYGGLHRLVDEGDAGDEYNYSPPLSDAPVRAPARVAAIRRLETGPLRGTLELDLAYRIPASLAADRAARAEELVELPMTLRVSLESGRPRLDCELELENRARDHRLRIEFPLPFSGGRSHADGAFYVATRDAVLPRHEAEAGEWELPTYPMRTFVDASDGRRGLALITVGLHEYELMPGPPPVLALTLLRAVGWLSRGDLRYRTGGAGPSMETPGAQVPGRHRFRYSLYFHKGGWEAAGLWRAAEATLLPMELVMAGPAAFAPQRTPARIHLEPETLQMTACVPRPYGCDLRLLNASDGETHARVRLNPPPAEVRWVTLGGETRERLLPGDSGYGLRLRPWELATLQVQPAP